MITADHPLPITLILKLFSISKHRKSVVDPGFPRRGRQLMVLGHKPIIWQDFWQKLHENERNWTERGRVPGAPSFGSANAGSILPEL